MKIIFCLLLAASCSMVARKDKEPAMHCLKITQLSPLFENDGSLTGYDTAVAYMYEKGNQVWLHSSYRHNYRKGVNGILIKTEIRFRDFVYTKGSRYGILFNKTSGKIMAATDSILSKEWVYGFGKIYNIFIDNNCSLISTVKDATSGAIEKHYSIRNKNDTSIIASITLSFTAGWRKRIYSLSEELEEMHQAILNKVHIVNSPRTLNSGVHYGEIDQEWSVEDVPVKDEEKITHYFEEAQNYIIHKN